MSKPGRGRPRAQLTTEDVIACKAAGLDNKQIAAKFGVSTDTVERRANPKARKDNRAGTKQNTPKKPGGPIDISEYRDANPAPIPVVGSEQIDDVSEQAATTVNGRKWLLSKVVGNDLKQRYWYNKDDDRYITVIRGIGEPIVTSGAEHRAICQAYSNFTGNAATLNQMAMQFGMPRPWLIQYLRIHGVTHDKEPFSAEELMERSTEDLVDDLYNMKRLAVNTALNEKVWKETKVAAAKWNAFEHTVLGSLEDWSQRFQTSYRPPLLSLNRASNPYSALLLPMDLHYGKGCWLDEAGKSYSRAQCTDLLKRHTEKLMNRLQRFGRPTEIIIPFGSDWFHVDNDFGGTSRGTPQDLDGTPEMILTEGMELKIEMVDMVRQVGPVTLLPCRGNHDHHSAAALMIALKMCYRGQSDVTVKESLLQRNYHVTHNTLIGTTHGDGVKIADLPTLMANEEPQAWYETKHKLFATGHLHSEELEDLNGVIHYRAPSLSGADRWHDNKGFVLSRQGMAAVVIDAEDGPCEFIVSPRDNRSTVGFKIKNQSRAA